MYSTQAYLYQQRTQVLLIDTSGQYFSMRYNPVYAKKLTLNLGVDNVLLFSFVNQDEKPVNVTACTFTFRVTNTAGTTILLQETMEILDAYTGQVKVTVPAASTRNLLAQPASYSIQVHRGTLTQAVFTDANSGARADIDLVNSVFPQFVPSTPLTIPTIKLSAQATTDGAGMQNFPSWAGSAYWNGPNNGAFYNSYVNTEYFSSFISPRNYVTTVQIDLIGYTGTIKAQWAENYQSIWYNVTESDTYYNETKTVHMNINGWYPLVRLCFNNSIFATPTPPGVPATAYAFCNDGVVTAVEVMNGGAGYLAPPKINIIGNGSGAAVAAIMSNTYPPGHPQEGIGYGTVVGFDIISGGAGYWPVPAGSINTSAYPVPAENQGAFVAITTGFVTNLMYR